MPETMLILTCPNDPHADIVVDALKKKGARVVRFHTADFPQEVQLTEKIEDGIMRGRISLPGECLDLGDIASVWYR